MKISMKNHIYPQRSLMIIFILLVALFWLSAPTHAQEPVRLQIDSIGVNAPIHTVYIRQFADGSVTWDVSRLRMSVGRYDGLANFGEGGNVVLGGHSELGRGNGDVFYRLHEVQVGEMIRVTQGDCVREYEVVATYVVDVYDLSPLMPTDDERLTLMTCALDSYDGRGNYTRRNIVVAVRR